MSLFTRFGNKITLVRRATLDDIKTFEGRKRKIDKHDRVRTAEGWRAIAKYDEIESGTAHNEILVDAEYLRADDGWDEIEEAFKALCDAETGAKQ